VEFLFLNLF